jgi:hypothetical protein
VTPDGRSPAPVVRRFARVALRALALLLVVALALEAGLRFVGAQPQNLYRAGFSATVIDRWTEWGMRPNVRLSEYSVTNNYGLHEDREINLARPPGVKRVAVIGSSVTWGLGEPLVNTIPRAAEAALRKAGCSVEVLNFGGQGYNILNASAYIQTKMHQFEPDAIVVMMDLQMAFPRFPRPNPVTDEQAVVRRLGFFEGLFKRATEFSTVLTFLDNVALPREVLARHQPLPLPKPTAASTTPPVTSVEFGAAPLRRARDAVLGWAGRRLDRLRSKDNLGDVTIAAAPPAPPATAGPPTREAYEARRERELSGVVSGVSAFARAMGLKLYFVTPFGPYFHATDAQLAKFSLNMLAAATPVYGGLAQAARREAELSSTIIARNAEREGAAVIDMLPLSRDATMDWGDFSTDGIHFSPQGYRRVGGMIADRLMRDGLCRTDPAKGLQ